MQSGNRGVVGEEFQISGEGCGPLFTNFCLHAYYASPCLIRFQSRGERLVTPDNCARAVLSSLSNPPIEHLTRINLMCVLEWWNGWQLLCCQPK